MTDRDDEIIERLTHIETLLDERCDARLDACGVRFTALERRRSGASNNGSSGISTRLLIALVGVMSTMAGGLVQVVAYLIKGH
jgi:hypothetical protein